MSRSDNIDNLSRPTKKKKRKRKLKHLVTHSAYREVLLSRLMRPFEIIVALLSPAFSVSARVVGRGALAGNEDTPNCGMTDAANRRRA